MFHTSSKPTYSLQRDGSRLAAAVPTAASTHAKTCCRQLRLYSRVAHPRTTGENRATKCLVHSPCHAGRE